MAQTVRFYTDEHVAKAAVRGLRQRGADVLTVIEAGQLAAPDSKHLERARSDGRVIVTQDADFLRFHAEGHPHAGIVFVPHGTPVGRLVRGLMLIRQVLDAEEMVAHVEFL